MRGTLPSEIGQLTAVTWLELGMLLFLPRCFFMVHKIDNLSHCLIIRNHPYVLTSFCSSYDGLNNNKPFFYDDRQRIVVLPVQYLPNLENWNLWYFYQCVSFNDERAVFPLLFPSTSNDSRHHLSRLSTSWPSELTHQFPTS